MIFAVHISDSVLTVPWWALGWLVAAVFAAIGAWRIRDDEIPRVALLTAAFFITSSIHIYLGPVNFHLLLNGLVGVLLGRRAGLAIPLAVFLQFLILGHGGMTTVGVNSCVMLLPALVAGWVFPAVRESRWYQHHAFRFAFLGIAVFAWSIGLCFSVALLATYHGANGGSAASYAVWGVPLIDPLHVPEHYVPALLITFNMVTIAGLLAASLIIAFLVERLPHASDFSLGLVIGGGAVLGSIALNCAVLLLGGEEDWTYPAFLTVVFHLPLAAVEGVILGSAVCFLDKVKPEMLDRSQTK